MEDLNNYTFETDKYYFINENNYGKLNAGLFLGTTKKVEFFDTEQEWLDRLSEFDIEPNNFE